MNNILIKKLAIDFGFSACGIGRVEPLDNERERLKSWLGKSYHGIMKYMARDPEKRLNPGLIMKDARSIIILAYHYAPDPAYIPKPPFTIARFALGLDYHVVLKEKAEKLVQEIQQKMGTFKYQVSCDSAPVLEKAWAVKTGIGWRGKNSIIQLPGRGSWFLLCEILTELELTPDEPYTGQHCGNCRRCLDACPTKALTSPYVLDARKCLSYLNVEVKGEFEPGTGLYGHLYGCDVCQEACPYNRTVPFNGESWLKPNPTLATLEEEDWTNMDENTFRTIFKDTGIKRYGYSRFVRNLQSVKKP